MTQNALEDYLKMQYPFQVIADPDGGYVVTFPDLPGCMTQAETIGEIPAAAEDARQSWISAVYNDGEAVPLPSYPEEYSGKFVARLPRSLHRQLAEEADRQSVSLNQLVVSLLSQGGREAHLEQQLAQVEARLSARLDQLAGQVAGLQYPVIQMPASGDRRAGTSSHRPKFEDQRSKYAKAS